MRHFIYSNCSTLVQVYTKLRIRHFHQPKNGSSLFRAQARPSDCQILLAVLRQEQANTEPISMFSTSKQDGAYNFVIINNCLQSVGDGDDGSVPVEFCPQRLLDSYIRSIIYRYISTKIEGLDT